MAAGAVAERERIAYLEALTKDPDAAMTQAEGEEWFAYVDASKPAWPEPVTVEEGEEFPEPSKAEADLEAEWDRWYANPVADILFPLQAAVRVHVPPRFDVPTRSEARPRGRRSSRRRAGPARPEDDPPEPDLASLRAISPEAFAHVLEAAGL
jgi:hypothetical protein